jgi:hypothetical protein
MPRSTTSSKSPKSQFSPTTHIAWDLDGDQLTEGKSSEQTAKLRQE